MNNNGFIIADCLDLVAYVAYTNITTTEVLNWVYTIVLIISVVFGIVLKIISAVKDKKVTKEELEDIKKEMDDACEKLKENTKKEDK